MAAERDQAGTPRAGLSGAGRDTDALTAGTSGSAAMGDRGLGSAEVHTGLHSGGGDEYSGLQFAGSEREGGVGGRVRGAAGAVRERASSLAGSLGARAGETASAARERMSGVRQRANTALESRGLLDRLRENPLPVIGVAFALGFVLAGNDDWDDDEEPTRASRARRELRSALMAGLSAGIAQGARGFLNQAGSEGGSFLSSVLENLAGGGESEYGGSRSSGGSYGSTGGMNRTGSMGGSTGGTGRSSMGGSGSTAGTGSSYAGGTSTQRPPSHQEY
jgi:hypothetical protein